MPLASLLHEVANLTVLVIVVLGFIALLIFRKEFKGLLGRLTEFEWRGAKLRAEESEGSVDEKPRSTQGAADAPQQESEADSSDPVEEGAERDTDGEDADAIRSAMFHAYFNGDREEGDRRFARLGALVDDATEIKRDKARRLAATFLGGIDNDAMSRLAEMTEDPDVASFAHRMIGMCFEHTGQPAEAAEEYRLAVAGEPAAQGRARAQEQRAKALIAVGEAELARDELEAALPRETDAGALPLLWGALAQAYEATEQKPLRAIALHKLAEQVGNSAGRWFDAGFAYGNAELPALAPLSIHCYRMAVRFDAENQWSINNLGAAASNLELNIPGVEFYLDAIEQGNTMAMANLSEKYLYAGFVDEAEQMIERARQAEDPHEKVATVAAAIRDRRSKERASLAEFEARGRRAAAFLSRYLSARLQTTPELQAAGSWTLKDGADVQLSNDGGKLELLWKAAGSHPNRRFRGSIQGSTATGSFEKESDWPYSDDKIHWEADGDGHAILLSTSELDLLRFGTEEDQYLRISAG